MKIPTPLRCLVFLAAFWAFGPAAAAAQDLRLVTAAADQDREAVLALLGEGVDVNVARPDGATALLWATHRDDVGLVERLLRAGADVNAADDHGVTPLERAAENASFAMVEMLLAAGADVNARQTSGLTPLMTAARTGSVDVVRALVNGGADVNAAVTETGSTALMWAVSEPHPEIVRLLLDTGADPRASTVKGFTPLMYAARNGDVSTAAALVAAGSDVNEPSADGTHVLPFAIVSGRDAFAMYLLEQGADPDGRMGGVSALHAAAGNVSPWLVEWYRRHGRGRLYAGLGGARLGAARRLALVEALLDGGADPNGRITTSTMIMNYIGYPEKGGVRAVRLRHRRPARRDPALGGGLRHERRAGAGARLRGDAERHDDRRRGDAGAARRRRRPAPDHQRRDDAADGRGRARAGHLHPARAARRAGAQLGTRGRVPARGGGGTSTPPTRPASRHCTARRSAA